MNEQEIKNLLSVYQQRVNDLMSQAIAFEARVINSNQIIENLTNKINELDAEIEKLKKTKRGAKLEEDFT